MRDPSALTFWHSCCLYLATSRRRVFLSGRRQFRIFYTLCYLAAVLGKCSLFYPFGLFFLNLVIIPSETLIFRNDQIMHGSLSSSPYSFTLLLCPPYAFPLPQLTRPTWCSRSAVTPSAEPVLSYVRPLGTVVMFFCFVLFLHRRVVIIFCVLFPL